jgi:acyl dehydratase
MAAKTPEKPRQCLTVADMKVGDRFVRDYTVSYDDVRKFAEISGDWNPVHHDPEYAATTIFKAQIAHGMISVAKFSGIFGMDTPGLGAVWTMQNVTFKAPVYLDKPYKAIAEVSKVDADTNTVWYKTWCEAADGTVVLEGEGSLKPIPAKVKAKMMGTAA